MSSTTRVLFVCLGNICRSPAAEGVFLQQLTQAGLQERYAVDSAGTGGWHVGKPADARMHRAAARRGIALQSRARQLEPADLGRFDHILTMDADNLNAVEAMARRWPREERRAVVAPLVRYCQRLHASEVPDPYYGGDDGFERVLDLLDDACEGLLMTLEQG